MMVTLGKLQRVDLREVWETEDRDFTPWLAREEHLSILAETIGLDLEFEAQEKDVGPFRADILCKNMDDDSWVLIENQVERTDHKHLGQLLTYAAGLQAVTIVWVASKFTDEHRATLDWLNLITNDNFRFFGLEVELWRIDNSVPAPKFNIISQPNNWSKKISRAAQRIVDEDVSETKELQFRYWTKLVNYLEKTESFLNPQAARPRHWQIFSIGRSGVHMAATVNTNEKRLAVEVCMRNPETSKAFFKLLEQDKEKIEQEFGQKLEWFELPNKARSKIMLYNNADPANEADWESQHEWIKNTVEKFDRVFRQRIKNLDLSAALEQEESE